ncbi:MAG: flagellar basal body-associated FliL family protein [Lachnospiraceae bacterium]|nr:flagellar basal body-associated FliL family protein [Lachnospiraceae bacterium]
MKKNLLSVIILALLIVNIALTAVMMFNVTSTNKKVANLIGNIATVMNLELTTPGEAEQKPEISPADTEVYSVAGSMTLALAPETTVDSNGKSVTKQNYLMCNVSFSVNTKHEDYKTYGSAEALANREALIKDAISSVVSKHTLSELQADPGMEGLKAEILQAVQGIYQSDFIYKVLVSDVKFAAQ